MAIFDAMLELSDDQDIGTISAAGVLAATNTFNWTQSDLEMGAGDPLWLNIKMGTEALLSTGAATCTFALKRETDTTIDATSSTVWSTTIAKASLTAGAWVVRMPLPYDIDADAYMGLLYTINTSDSSAGKVDAWIDHGPQSSYDTQVSASNI